MSLHIPLQVADHTPMSSLVNASLNPGISLSTGLAYSVMVQNQYASFAAMDLRASCRTFADCRRSASPARPLLFPLRHDRKHDSARRYADRPQDRLIGAMWTVERTMHLVGIAHHVVVAAHRRHPVPRVASPRHIAPPNVGHVTAAQALLQYRPIV